MSAGNEVWSIRGISNAIRERVLLAARAKKISVGTIVEDALKTYLAGSLPTLPASLAGQVEIVELLQEVRRVADLVTRLEGRFDQLEGDFKHDRERREQRASKKGKNNI